MVSYAAQRDLIQRASVQRAPKALPVASTASLPAPPAGRSSAATGGGPSLHRLRSAEPLREATSAAVLPARSARCVVLSAGRSPNLTVYTDEVLRRSALLFDGTRVNLNHASHEEEARRAEGDLERQAGRLGDCRVETVDGVLAITGTLHFSKNAAGDQAFKRVESAFAHQAQFPDAEPWAGLSVNCAGTSTPEMGEDGTLARAAIKRLVVRTRCRGEEVARAIAGAEQQGPGKDRGEENSPRLTAWRRAADPPSRHV